MLRVIQLLHFELAGEEMKQFHFLRVSYSIQTELIDTKMTSWRIMNNKNTFVTIGKAGYLFSLQVDAFKILNERTVHGSLFMIGRMRFR